LSQFGVNLVRLKPGAASSARHWHEQEDEFVYMIEGELVLVEDEGETIVKPGDAAGFKAGVPNGHHLLNRTTATPCFSSSARARHANAVTTPISILLSSRTEIVTEQRINPARRMATGNTTEGARYGLQEFQG